MKMERVEVCECNDQKKMEDEKKNSFFFLPTRARHARLRVDGYIGRRTRTRQVCARVHRVRPEA